MDSHAGRLAPFLPRGPLFAQLDLKALDDIRRYTRPRRYAAGDVMCQEGDRSDSVLLLQHGFADVNVTSRAEKRSVTVRHLHAGDIVGEVGVLTGLPRSATVIASSDTRAVEIAREDFHRLLADHPRLEANLSRLLGTRLASGNSALRGTGQGVVALVVGTNHLCLADRVVEAAFRATRRPPAIVDLRNPREALAGAKRAPALTAPGHTHTAADVRQALEHLDRLETTHETVILVVAGE